MFKFHNIFHGLIGLDNLKILQASINYDTGHLITPYTKIKLLFHKIQNNLNLITIEPRSEQVIKVRTSIPNGEIIIPHQKFHNCEIPECLTIARNSQAITTILNNTTSPVTLDFSVPLVVERFDRQSIEQINFNNFDETPKQKTDVSKLIRTEHLNSEEKEKIINLCKEFADIFYRENAPLTFTSRIKHQIKTTDDTPVYSKSYRYPFIHKQEVQNQIKKMLDSKIIRESTSPYSAPLWVVPKKADASGKQKWRVVIDYRKLNEKTVDDRYPLPNITDLLDKLGKCQYFSTLDLASGFHQIEMDERDIEKTAFSTENGHYEFLRMPFGLKNAPATFQRCMDNILRGIQNEKCVIYLDDILVYSVSLQEHLDRLRCVFQRLRESNFKIQLDKSEFLCKEVAYLGHVITPEGIKPNPDKIRAIKNFPLPRTTKQIKGFLGLLGYYRRFIKDFSKITKPFTKCLKKGAKIEINDEYLSCFENCKNLLTNEPILQYPNFSQPFNLTTDASQFAIGAILSQGPIGKDLPIAYASRTLNESEQNYSVIQKELLAIVWATKYFRPYLFGRKFNIITDHKPLEYLFSVKDPNSRLLRWRIKLEEFDYRIIYRRGKLNNADPLSRVEIHTKDIQSICDETVDKILSLSEYRPENQEQDTDNSSLQVQIGDNDGNPQTTQSVPLIINEPGPAENLETPDEVATVHSNANANPVVGIPIVDYALNYGQNQVIIKPVLHSPAKPKITILFEKKKRVHVQISRNNFEQDVTSFVRNYISPNIKYHVYFENPDDYEPFSNILQRNFQMETLKLRKCNTKLIDVTDKAEVKNIIQAYHEAKTNHRGSDETLQRIKQKYYWPQLKNSIQTYINDCEICQQAKYERHPVNMKLNVTPTPTKPFEIIHLDTFTFEQTKFLTIIDSFSKYAQAYPLMSLSGTEISDNLIYFFSHHGIPKQIVTDNGTEFKNTVVSELLTLHKIQVHFCSPNHPQSNGVIERFHSTLIEHLRLLNTKGFSKTPIRMKMTNAILAYNHSLHSITKHKPIDIIYGHITSNDPFNIELDQILVNDYVNAHKERSKVLYSKINEELVNNKEKTIAKRNQNRDDPTIFQPQQKIFVKKHIRQKNANKFNKPTHISSINSKMKTVSTENINKIHMDNLKRPLKRTYSF